MSDELNALQETAVQARTKSDEQNAALTDASSDQERAAAADANNVATAAESTYADAKAQAEADAAARGGGGAENKNESGIPDANKSRTGYADEGLHAGDACVCPDGRKGTVHKFDQGLICIPNADQG
jgi:hypothetical protein